LAEEIAELDVGAFSCPVLPRKQDDAAATKFRYEGYDIITLQKLIEREYSIPEPQTAEEVIGFYARRIAQDVKLPSQFSALAPKVREFLETKAFGGPVIGAAWTMRRASRRGGQRPWGSSATFRWAIRATSRFAERST